MTLDISSSSIDLLPIVRERIATITEIRKRWQYNEGYRLRLDVELMGLNLLLIKLLEIEAENQKEILPEP